MSHTLNQTRNKNPMWFFEKSYLYLLAVFPKLAEDFTAVQKYQDNVKTVFIHLLEVSRYTSLIFLQLDFNKDNNIPAASMTIRLYHDAKLADVVSYQNIERLVAPYFSSSKKKLYNHKKQANILLYELLSGCMNKMKSTEIMVDGF